MARYRRYAEALRPLCHQQVADQRPGRRQQAPRWRVRRVLQALVAAVYADQQLDPVVVGRDVLVSYRPVEPQPVAPAGLEVVGTVAQRDSPPVIRATTQHARPPPIKATRRLVARAHIGLSGYLPAAVHGGVVEAKGLLRRADARERRLVRRLEHGRLGCGVVPASRLERSEEHTSELQSQSNLVCRLLLEKKKEPYIPPASSTARHQRDLQPAYSQLTS